MICARFNVSHEVCPQHICRRMKVIILNPEFADHLKEGQGSSLKVIGGAALVSEGEKRDCTNVGGIEEGLHWFLERQKGTVLVCEG